MSLVVSFRLVPSFLETALAAAPTTRLQIEQAAAIGAATLFSFRATSDDFERFEAGLADDPTIEATNTMGRLVDGERLYRIRVPTRETTYHEWVALGAVLLDATVTDGGWNVRMRFPDREALSTYQNHCADRGIDFTLRSVRDASESASAYPYGLTAPQYEILAAAIDGGYFEVPRDTRMGDLAREFDISDQAASERLRRGLSRLLETLAVDEYYQ